MDIKIGKMRGLGLKTKIVYIINTNSIEEAEVCYNHIFHEIVKYWRLESSYMKGVNEDE